MPLGVYPRTLDDCLQHWRAVRPSGVFLAERDGREWRERTYEQVAESVDLLAARLLRLNLSSERPMMIVSANSILHAEVALAAMRIGVPVAPISPNYVLNSADVQRLRLVLKLLTPGAVYLDRPDAYGTTLSALSMPLFSETEVAGLSVRSLEDIEPLPHELVTSAAASTGPDTIAKFLFTSGSTGGPKCVVNTQRMLCSAVKALALIWPFLSYRPPVLVDWMPWTHTFGGNCCFNLVLFHGGTLFIDGGRPTPDLIERTIANLRSRAPTMYFNVPAGYQALLPYLETDPAFAKAFFGNLDCLFSGGAALPADIRKRLMAIGNATSGRPPLFTTSLGSTECGGPVTAVYFETEETLNIGVPIPGASLKMLAQEGKMALAIRGPNVMPGYWRQPEATAAAFDAEGFYGLGDAGFLIDPDDPNRGLAFDGRIAENFKLNTGTWVNTAAIRLATIEAAKPLVNDAVVTGHNRTEVGVLVFLNWQACRRFLHEAETALTEADIAQHPAILRHIDGGLAAYNLQHPSSSTRVARFDVLSEEPCAFAGEITDKKYLNQRAILERRKTAVEKLYTDGHVVGH